MSSDDDAIAHALLDELPMGCACWDAEHIGAKPVACAGAGVAIVHLACKREPQQHLASQVACQHHADELLAGTRATMCLVCNANAGRLVAMAFVRWEALREQPQRP